MDQQQCENMSQLSDGQEFLDCVDCVDHQQFTFESPFCTQNNIHSCLEYLSEQLVALGFPSIIAHAPVPCPNAASCDTVTFINVAHELLQWHFRDINTIKKLQEDIVCFSSNLMFMKNMIRQREGMLRFYHEQEERLTSELGTLQRNTEQEKDETYSVISCLLRQQELYEQDKKKKEKEIQKLKLKIRQISNEEAPEERSGNRNPCGMFNAPPAYCGQRKKWNRETTRDSGETDKMYRSVVQNYESRCQNLLNDLTALRNCMKIIEDEISNLVKVLKDYGSRSADDEIDVIMKDLLLHHAKEESDVKGREEILRKQLRFVKTTVQKLKETQIRKTEKNAEASTEEKSLEPQTASTAEKECTVKSEQEDTTAESEKKRVCEDKYVGLLKEENESMRKQLKLLNEEKSAIEKDQLSLIRTARIIKKEKDDLNESKLEFVKAQMLHSKIMKSKSDAKFFDNVESSPSILHWTPCRQISTDAALHTTISFTETKNELPNWVYKSLQPNNRWLNKSMQETANPWKTEFEHLIQQVSEDEESVTNKQNPKNNIEAHNYPGELFNDHEQLLESSFIPLWVLESIEDTECKIKADEELDQESEEDEDEVASPYSQSGDNELNSDEKSFAISNTTSKKTE